MIVVTASSFLKHQGLCHKLTETLSSHEIRFVSGAESYSKKDLSEILKDADGWLIGRETCDGSLLRSLPKLRVVSKYGVGLDNIDLQAAQDCAITVAYQAGVNREAVAEHTLGLMLACLRNIGQNSQLLRQGIWNKAGGKNLHRRRVGIVGLGHIGMSVARLLKAFDCEISFCDIRDRALEAEQLGLQVRSYQELLTWSEIVSFHVPLTELTRNMLSAETLSWTQQGVYLINTSRGEVIDQEALKACLINGHVAGAGLDVFRHEPLEDKSLYSLENIVCTPHTAGNSQEAVMAMGLAAIEGLQKVLA